MAAQHVPLRPSRLKVLLAVGWVIVAVAVTGWTVEQPVDEPEAAGARHPVMAMAGSAQLAASQAVESVPDDSPLLTLLVVAAIGAAAAAVLTIRVVRPALRSGHAPVKLTPSQAVVGASAPRGRSTRRREGLAGH
jgi:hypothetical protein